MSSIAYRSDIDGLRAIAVLSVVFCHANPAWLPGGYVGVDIFFVISGFLISSIVYREVVTGEFTFANFYVRRIKRILPVFFVVLAVVLVAGSLLFSAREMTYLGKSARYATLFGSNFYFADMLDYFAPDKSEMPLLHTWSLAVEEQYYFIWPLLMLLLVKLRKRQMLAITALIGVTSFIFATIFAMNSDTSSWNYYQLPSRMGELMIGSMLAITRPAVKYANVMAALGMGLIVASFLMLSDKSVFPGYNALWPCLGTALLIYSGSANEPRPLINRLLSLRPVVFVGLLSYSLYLWHWPILSYTRYVMMNNDLPVSIIIGCILLSLALSWMTWRWIEQPIRKKKLSFRTAFIRYFLQPAVVVLLFSVATKQTHGYLWHQANRKVDQITTETLGCFNYVRKSCTMGDVSTPVHTIMFGDSHALHFSVVFDRLARQQHWSVDFFTVYGCPFLEHNYGRFANDKNCPVLTDYVYKNLNHYENIIIAHRWYAHLYPKGLDPVKGEEFKAQFEKTVEHFSREGKQVFLIAQVPEFKVDPLRRYKRDRFRINHADIDKLEYIDYGRANQFLKGLSEKYPHVYYIDFDPVIRKWKNALVNGVPVYVDHTHLNQYGQEQLFKSIEHDPDYEWIGQTIRGKTGDEKQ